MLMSLVIFVSGLAIGFIFGILFGRQNKRKSDAIYNAAKKAEEEAEAFIKRAKKK